jgi:hypothetical protein
MIKTCQTGTEYFLDSCSMIRGFIEPKAKIEDYSERNKLIYHKIGHSLHTLNPVFKAATYNERTEVSACLINLKLRF